jgi:DNA repair protein RecO (recombination protein O)
MPRTYTVDAIVLRTTDIGEADRFCVLFTRELGKVMARASGVRKPKSAMGGALLPLRHITVQLKEWQNGYIVQSAETRPETHIGAMDIQWFGDAQQGIELLMRLTEDGQPLPEVFHATLQFLTLCGDASLPWPLAYSIRLTHLLGLLPDRSHISDVYGFVPEDDTFFEAARSGQFSQLQPPAAAIRIHRFMESMLSDHVTGPLRAPGIAASLY